MHQVDDHPPRSGAAERIAVHAGTGRRREFGHNPLSGQFDRIVAARRPFAVMRKRIRLRQVLAVAHHFGPGGGMEQNVGQVGAARSAQMRMGKAVDRLIVVMIARTGIPIVRPRIGTELHHAEWGRGAGIGMSVKSGPDEGIDIFERSGRMGTGGARKRSNTQNQGSHHGRSDRLEFYLYKCNKAAPQPTAIYAFASSFPADIAPKSTEPQKIADKKSGPDSVVSAKKAIFIQ